jgi:hypothetical protein
MGNQCCEGERRNGEASNTTFTRFQYTFQEDSEEIGNPVLRTSTFANHSPPNEFSERTECEVPKLTRNVQDLLDNVCKVGLTQHLHLLVQCWWTEVRRTLNTISSREVETPIKEIGK